MISADLILPQQQIYNFLRSVTIKFSPIAQYINNHLLQNGHVVDMQDPTTWKYYINMTGEYHSSDTLMYVTSLDTRQEILFSPSMLDINPRTKQAYLPGGQYYNRLCELYPSQVDLIKSILFPVSSIDEAITAKDFTLLKYGEGYLEFWEEPLIIMEIEKFLSIYVERWYFDFLDDEPYFYLTAWSTLWFFLAMVIMSARMEFIRTPYVHSWHIWNELQANGIANYSDILTREQSMMLYQNISYLKANAGKQSNLIILADNLLANFGIGLYGRQVIEETETNSDTYQLTPSLAAIKIPTDYGSLAIEIPPEPVSIIQTEIYKLGLTAAEDAVTVATIEEKLGTTTLNNFNTKLLEIRPIAKNTPFAQSLSNFFLDTLVLCIHEGYYTNGVQLIEPLTGTILYLTPSELLAMFNYAIQQSLNVKNDNICTTYTLSSSFLPTIGTPVKSFYRGGLEYVIKNFIDVNDYLGGLTYNTNIASPEDFTSMTSGLWLKYMEHMLADLDTTIDKKRVILAYLDSLCHSTRNITLSLVPSYTSYSEWFGPNGINVQNTIFSQYSSQENVPAMWQNLALAIMTALIPIDDTIKAFTDLTLSSDDYHRLTELFVAMCSYKVLFLQASPEVPTFTVGAKWDNVYGPDAVSSFGLQTEILRLKLIQRAVSRSEVLIDSGVDNNIALAANTTTDYIYQYTTTMTGDVATQGNLRPQVVSATSSTVVSQGPLNFPYTPMTPIIPIS